MKKTGERVRKLSVLLLTCLLLLSFCSAVSADGFQAAFPNLYTWLESIENGRPVEAYMSLVLNTILPLNDVEVETLNQLFSYVNADLYYHQGTDALQTEVDMYFGNKLAFSFGEREYSNFSEAYITGLGDKLLTSEKESALEIFLGTNGIDSMADAYTKVLRYDDMRNALVELLKPLEEFGKSKKQTFSIKNVGKATNSIVYTFPKDQGDLFKEMLLCLAEVSAWKEATAVLSSMSLASKGTLTAYYTASEELIGIAYTGDIALGEATTRKITFLWGFSTDEKRDIHTFSLKAPATKGSDNLTITGSLVWDYQNGKEGVTFDWSVTSRLSGQTEKQMLIAKLANNKNEYSDTVMGEISLTKEANQNTEIWSIKPDFLLENNELNGSVKYTHTYNKKVQEDITLSLIIDDAYSERLPFGGISVDVSNLVQNELEILENTVADSIAYGVLTAALQLPEEDLYFFSSGMAEIDWNRVMQTFTGNQ